MTSKIMLRMKYLMSTSQLYSSASLGSNMIKKI